VYRILKVTDYLQSLGKGHDTLWWKHYTNTTICLPVWEWNLQQPNTACRRPKGGCSKSHMTSGMRKSILSSSLNLLEYVGLFLQYSVTYWLQYHRTEFFGKRVFKTASSFRQPKDHNGSYSQTVSPLALEMEI